MTRLMYLLTAGLCALPVSAQQGIDWPNLRPFACMVDQPTQPHVMLSCGEGYYGHVTKIKTPATKDFPSREIWSGAIYRMAPTTLSELPFIRVVFRSEDVPSGEITAGAKTCIWRSDYIVWCK